jgi:uncharacterized protein (TIGR03086 family)
MDVFTLYHRSVEHFADRLAAIRDDQWGDPTPCTEWDVRALVNHVTYENVWTVPLMQGATIEEVGDRFEGDLLGDDPIGAALTAARAAIDSVRERLPQGGEVHLSFGDRPAEEYARQLAADHLLHGWDVAAATSGDRRMDPHLVSETGAWFRDSEEGYREYGAVGDRGYLTGEPQGDLLARFGRDPSWGPHHGTLARFNAAFGSGDVEAALALSTDDVVFDSTSPSPDGTRVQGKDAVREVWRVVMTTPGMTFTEEESFVAGDRAVVRWVYGWEDGHVRGVDVMRFRDGLVSEKLSYVKG